MHGDVRRVMLKAARVRLERRFAVLPGIVVLSEPQLATRAAVIQVR